MGLKDKNLISLKEIDGPQAPHDAFLKRMVDLRKDALAYVDDVARLGNTWAARLRAWACARTGLCAKWPSRGRNPLRLQQG